MSNTKLSGFAVLIGLLLTITSSLDKACAQETRDSVFEQLFNRFSIPADKISRPPFFIAQMPGEVAGVTVIRELDAGLAIVRIVDTAIFRRLKLAGRIAPANDHWKLSSSLSPATLASKSNRPSQYIITAFPGHQLDTILSRQKGVLFMGRNDATHSVIIRCTPGTLREIIAFDGVRFADLHAPAREETNIIGYDRSFHGISAVDHLVPGANGKNIIVGVKEQSPDKQDPDLWMRVLASPLAANTTSYHATVISSLIGGAGNSSYQGRGIAWGCRFFPSTFDNLFADDATILASQKVSVQNHSYGTIIQQHYGAEAVSYDLLTWRNPTLLPVMSSGNQGAASAGEGKYAGITGFANLTGNFKMAKNIITVGAIDNKYQIHAQSSAGPLYDGRVAPQLIALGPSGTSDASAIVSGTIAVMQQVYADSNSAQLPPSSLVRAVLFTTADDVYSPGVDYKTGYGMLNSLAAVRAMQRKAYDGGSVSQGGEWQKMITVPPGIAMLKATLVWTDTAATVNNLKALVNDLDLELQNLTTGEVIHPWVLNPFPHKDSLSQPPLRKRDSLNTAEQLSITSPSPGNYAVKVKGTAVAANSISFHVAYRLDTLNTFRFTNPVHASDIYPDKNPNLNIKWEVFTADPNATGTLSISYDQGINWHVIQSPVDLSKKMFSWTVHDTSSTAVLRMQTSFGDFLSVPFVIAPPLILQADFNCADSFRVSWPRYPYAHAYRVYTLSDSPYLKQVITTTDSFAVFQKAMNTGTYYAVEPVLSNNLGGTRSQAIDVNLQGVDCFYRTINYVLLDTNRLVLAAELSAIDYIDSVIFERVGPSGVLLQSLEGRQVVQGLTIYNTQVNDLPGGTSYFRARIRLKNGAVIFTETISITISGKRKILFYPNPAPRGASLSYVIEQGSTAARIMLFDISGRLVRSILAGDILQTGTLSTGVFIYKLLDEENRLLEAGKFVLY